MKQKKLSIVLPKSWNELSDRQLQAIALLFHTQKPGVLFDIRILFILMDTRWWELGKKNKLRRTLKEVPLSELKKHYGFIYNDRNRTVFLPYMIAQDEAFFAPMDRMTNISAEEFAVATDLNKLWHKEKKRNALEYMAAVLYSTAPNIRPPFEKDQLEAKAKLFTKVPLKELLAMKLAYDGCYDAITKRFPKAFPRHGTTDASGPKKNYGFGKVILQMAGGKFGTHEETKRTKIYTLLEQFEEDLTPKK